MPTEQNSLFPDCFIGIGTISCHVGVLETIEGVTVSSFNDVQPCMLHGEAKTSMVEAQEGADAGEVEGLRVVGGARCLGCHGHGLGCLMQEHNTEMSSLVALEAQKPWLG